MTVSHPPLVPTTTCKVSRVLPGVVVLARSGSIVIHSSDSSGLHFARPSVNKLKRNSVPDRQVISVVLTSPIKVIRNTVHPLSRRGFFEILDFRSYPISVFYLGLYLTPNETDPTNDNGYAARKGGSFLLTKLMYSNYRGYFCPGAFRTPSKVVYIHPRTRLRSG